MWCGGSSNIAVHRKKWLDRQRGWMSMWWLRQTLRCRLFATALHNWLALMIFFTGKETKLKKQSCPKSWLVSCRVFISWSIADAFFVSAVRKKQTRVHCWFMVLCQSKRNRNCCALLQSSSTFYFSGHCSLIFSIFLSSPSKLSIPLFTGFLF